MGDLLTPEGVVLSPQEVGGRLDVGERFGGDGKTLVEAARPPRAVDHVELVAHRVGVTMQSGVPVTEVARQAAGVDALAMPDLTQIHLLASFVWWQCSDDLANARQHHCFHEPRGLLAFE